MPATTPPPDHLPAPGLDEPWVATDPQLAEDARLPEDAWLDQHPEPPPWLTEYPEPEDPERVAAWLDRELAASRC